MALLHSLNDAVEALDVLKVIDALSQIDDAKCCYIHRVLVSLVDLKVAWIFEVGLNPVASEEVIEHPKRQKKAPILRRVMCLSRKVCIGCVQHRKGDTNRRIGCHGCLVRPKLSVTNS